MSSTNISTSGQGAPGHAPAAARLALWVLDITFHSGAGQTTIHSTHERAEQQLLDFVAEHWEAKVGPAEEPPDDPGEQIEVYMSVADESYRITWALVDADCPDPASMSPASNTMNESEQDNESGAMTTTTQLRDPLSLRTKVPATCRNGSSHGWTLGWLLEDGSFAAGYIRCLACGAVDWEGLDDDDLRVMGWTAQDAADYYTGHRHGPSDPDARKAANWPDNSNRKPGPVDPGRGDVCHDGGPHTIIGHCRECGIVYGSEYEDF